MRIIRKSLPLLAFLFCLVGFLGIGSADALGAGPAVGSLLELR
jgi:hypothetical protein